MTPGHRQIDHTADVALEIWAPTLPSLFVEGAAAIVDVLTDGRAASATTKRTTELEAVDLEDALVVWLNEVIYWAVTEGFLVASATIEVSAEQPERVVVVAEGEPIDETALDTELKSVTYHHLLLEERDDHWFGRVVIDV